MTQHPASPPPNVFDTKFRSPVPDAAQTHAHGIVLTGGLGQVENLYLDLLDCLMREKPVRHIAKTVRNALFETVKIA